MEFPQICRELEKLPCGIIPLQFPSKRGLSLIVKATKEFILCSKVNQGFDVYIVPHPLIANHTIGMISAFWDDEDEPLIISSPMFDDEHSRNILSLFSQPEFEIYFFDELNRELAGYIVQNDDWSVPKSLASQTNFCDQSNRQEILDIIPDWFGTRTAKTDSERLQLKFIDKLYPDDTVFFDLTQPLNGRQGETTVRHTMLERVRPGYLQEMEIATLLGRSFPATQIFLNPLRGDQNTEFVDVLVISDDAILLVQAKDSPNTAAILGRNLERKKESSISQLEKALAQLKGAHSYLKKNNILTIRTDGQSIEFDTKNRTVRCLVILKELFADRAEEYFEMIMALITKTETPCLVFDYSQLHQITASQDNEASFYSVYDEILIVGLQQNFFPKFRYNPDLD